MSQELQRSERFTLRFRKHEMRALRRKAARERMLLSEYIRDVVMRATLSRDTLSPQ